jgi:DNA-binding response OmpR family regulator
MDIFRKAYIWALSHNFEPIEIDYASKLALKMLDDSCQMSLHDREVFFNVYDAICDRADISLDDDVNRLIVLARNRDTIYSKPELATIVHACKEEIIPNMLKVHMKAFKAMVRKNLGIN